MSNNIQVAIKIRPLISRELRDNLQNQWQVDKNKLIPISGSNDQYIFDHVLTSDTTNDYAYNVLVKPVVNAALSGINATVFAYGQTSSGKTYTMMGSGQEPGLVTLTVQDIFNAINNSTDRDYLIRVSYIEIYNEKIIDLLDSKNSDEIKVHEDLNGGVYVKTTEEVVTSAAKLFSLKNRGDKKLSVGETNMNERSSRSHTIFKIIIESRESTEFEISDGAVQVAHLNLVDLAGSERASQTGAKGVRLKEGQYINKSLSTLGLVIRQLSEAGDSTQRFISFRDSKLTRILQSSLGGNAKTVMICNITPASYEESVSTLLFASSAKNIKNKPKVNEIVSDEAMLKRLGCEVQQLRKQSDKDKEHLAEVQRNNEKLEKRIAELHQNILRPIVLQKHRRRTWCAQSLISSPPPSIDTFELLHRVVQTPLNINSKTINEDDIQEPDSGRNSGDFDANLVRKENKLSIATNTSISLSTIDTVIDKEIEDLKEYHENERRSLLEENDGLKNKYNEAIKQLNEMQNNQCENEKLCIQIKKMEKEMELLKNGLNDSEYMREISAKKYSSRIKDLESLLNSANQESEEQIQQYIEEKEILDNTIKQLQEKNAELCQELDEMKTQINDNNKNMKNNIEQLNFLKKQLDEKTIENGDLSKKMNTLKIENNDFQQKYVQLKGAYNKVQIELNEVTEELMDHITNDSTDDLKKEIQSLKNDKEVVENELKQCQINYEKLQEEKETLEIEMMNVSTHHCKKEIQYLDEIENLNKSQTERDMLFENFTDIIQTQESQIDDLERRNLNKLCPILEIDSDIFKDFSDLKETVLTLNEMIVFIFEENNMFKRKNVTLANILDDYSDLIKTLKQENDNLKQQFNLLIGQESLVDSTLNETSNGLEPSLVESTLNVTSNGLKPSLVDSTLNETSNGLKPSLLKSTLNQTSNGLESLVESNKRPDENITNNLIKPIVDLFDCKQNEVFNLIEKKLLISEEKFLKISKMCIELIKNIKVMKSVNANLESENLDMQKKLVSLDGVISADKKTIELLNTEKGELNDLLLHKNSEYELCESDRKKILNDINSLQLNLNSLENLKNNLVSEIDNLKQDCFEKNKLIDILQLEKQETGIYVNELKVSLVHEKTEKEKLLKCNEVLKEKLDCISNEYNQICNKNKFEMNLLNTSISKLKMENSNLQEEFNKLNNLNENLKLDLIYLKTENNKHGSLKIENDKQIKDLTEKILVLENKKCNHCEKLQNELKDLSTLNENLKLDLIYLKTENDKHEIENDKQIKELTEKILVLENEKCNHCEKLQNELKDLSTLNENLKLDLIYLKTENDKHEIENDKQIKELTEKILVLENEKCNHCEKLQNELKDLSTLNENLKLDLIYLKTENDKLDSLKIDNDKQIKDLTEKILVLENEKFNHEKLQNELKDLSTLNENLKLDLLYLKTENDKLDSLKIDNDKQIKDLTEKILVLENEKCNHCEKLQNELKNLSTLNKDLTEKILVLENEKCNHCEKLQIKLKDLNTLNENLKLDLIYLKTGNDKLNSLKIDNDKQIKDLIEKILVLENEKCNHCEKLQNKLKDLSTLNKNLESEITTLQTEYENVKKENDMKEKTVAELNSKLLFVENEKINMLPIDDEAHTKLQEKYDGLKKILKEYRIEKSVLKEQKKYLEKRLIYAHVNYKLPEVKLTEDVLEKDELEILEARKTNQQQTQHEHTKLRRQSYIDTLRGISLPTKLAEKYISVGVNTDTEDLEIKQYVDVEVNTDSGIIEHLQRQIALRKLHNEKLKSDYKKEYDENLKLRSSNQMFQAKEIQYERKIMELTKTKKMNDASVNTDLLMTEILDQDDKARTQELNDKLAVYRSLCVSRRQEILKLQAQLEKITNDNK